MSTKLLRRPAAKRDRGRIGRVDSWEMLKLVVDLIKTSLPIDVEMVLNDADISRLPVVPSPYDPSEGSLGGVPMPLPATVRVSLFVDEELAWMLPVHFYIGQLLTGNEVIVRLADAVRFLRAWSQVHDLEGREHLGLQLLQAQYRCTPPSNRVQ